MVALTLSLDIKLQIRLNSRLPSGRVLRPAYPADTGADELRSARRWPYSSNVVVIGQTIHEKAITNRRRRGERAYSHSSVDDDDVEVSESLIQRYAEKPIDR